MGFMAMAFAVVGLTGLFATYAAPLPLERALLRETALDEVLAASHAPDPAAALALLRPRLDDSATVLEGPASGLAERIAAERVGLRQRFTAEAAATGLRLRVLIGLMTATAALFGAALLGSTLRGAPSD